MAHEVEGKFPYIADDFWEAGAYIKEVVEACLKPHFHRGGDG
jgi:hypothetical protein